MANILRSNEPNQPMPHADDLWCTECRVWYAVAQATFQSREQIEIDDGQEVIYEMTSIYHCPNGHEMLGR